MGGGEGLTTLKVKGGDEGDGEKGYIPLKCNKSRLVSEPKGVTPLKSPVPVVKKNPL